MHGLRILAPAIIVLAILSGCTAPRHLVDFSEVTDKEPGGSFALDVRIRGLTPEGTVPIEGAFVGAARDMQALAKAETDGDGRARLVVRSGQVLHLVAKATGWTTEQSNALAIGRAGSFACAPREAGCDLTADQEGREYGLASNGTVTLVLFPTRIESTATVRLSPTVVAANQVLPPGERWRPAQSVAHADADLARLQMLRFDSATATMTWTNDKLQQADVELGIGCDRSAPAKKTSANLPNPAQGKRSLTVDFSESHSGYWSECGHVFAGPYLDSVNTELAFDVKMELRFVGRSMIVPVQ